MRSSECFSLRRRRISDGAVCVEHSSCVFTRSRAALFLDTSSIEISAILPLSMLSDIQSILDGVLAYMPRADLVRIEAGYQFAKKAHEGQTRFSGEPYITHPVAATELLLELHPDEDSIIACFLHDVVEDTPVTVEEIEKAFGPTVAHLCGGLEKLGKVRFRGEERQVENLRKMFVAMADDLRVIFIKLADRLHNMQTLEPVRPDKRERIARETLEVYAPIAARLGLYSFKTKLEDLGFQYVYPEDYKKISAQVAGTAALREKVIVAACDRLRLLLRKENIDAVVTGRVKHLYSIYQKLQKKKYESVDEIYDLFALRVLVQTTGECYATLGILHNHFRPLSNRFKDFIAVPKSNGYQSLHTTVLGLDTSARGYPTEVQIRTQEMHGGAERGAAAHWGYTEHGKQSVSIEAQKLSWVKSLVELHDRLKDNREFVETLSTDVLRSRIFVLTPKGAVLDLPKGATPIDFAYHIHTDVGHTCVGAKVNGKIVPLNRMLDNGEVIEILRRRGGTPNRFWLSFVKTDGARTKIKGYFNALDRGENITAGRDLINRQLARHGQGKLDADMSILKNYEGGELSVKERENILERVGNSSITAVSVIKEILHLAEPPAHTPGEAPPAPSVHQSSDVVIGGEANLPFTLGKCCTPTPGTDIVALMSPRKGAVIHRTDCKMLLRANPDRQIPAKWGGEDAVELVWIRVEAKNRVGLLRDLAGVIADHNMNIGEIKLQKSEKHAIVESFQLEVESFEQLSHMLDSLERVAGVQRVMRVSVP